MDVVRAGWASASFLAYTGALTILLAAVWLESTLSDRYEAAAFVGWSALVLAGAAACAFAARRRERPLLAGLFAFVSVALFAVFVAALEDWFGWLSHDSPLHGFHLSLLLLEVLTVIAALWALHIFHHPLLVLAAAGVGWFFVTDVLSSGGNWSAWVTLLFGLFLLPIALGANPVYGFWLNVVSGVTIGGALLWFWHSGDWHFILIGAGRARVRLLRGRDEALELDRAGRVRASVDGSALHRQVVRRVAQPLVPHLRKRGAETRLGAAVRVRRPGVRLRGAGDRRAGALPGPGDYAPAGSRTVNREPLPGSDSTSSRPFMRSTSSRQM